MDLRTQAAEQVGAHLDLLGRRDEIVAEALRLGVPKAEISRRSGLSRPTIDKIAREASAACG